MKRDIEILDVVALMKDIPSKKLIIGQVGTVVEILGQDAIEVEFK
jgi:catabolite regulation protein CreA